ncbi:hypothetical protein HPHPP15B_0055 [Helicobacter pylori Hp P-15b]|uniref:Uncharacterized protein n=1 Tax=Helicobacter pylori Hp P-15 TaxID=992080 RepID=J0QDV2_HELPX|nr:hypothetical protein HPHPP15_0052 [Helicobacter pylori Hp P-15]EJC33960.1 hypothetical protein HPHPP15B_0055 [Helicobacter pylori Hp P-15b]
MKSLKAWIKTPLALLFKTFLPISAAFNIRICKNNTAVFQKGVK